VHAHTAFSCKLSLPSYCTAGVQIIKWDKIWVMRTRARAHTAFSCKLSLPSYCTAGVRTIRRDKIWVMRTRACAHSLLVQAVVAIILYSRRANNKMG